MNEKYRRLAAMIPNQATELQINLTKVKEIQDEINLAVKDARETYKNQGEKVTGGVPKKVSTTRRTRTRQEMKEDGE